MAILSRVKISPQQRYDLEDLFAMQASARTDAKLSVQKFLSELNYIMGGFSISGIGLNQATVAMSNAALIIPENSFDFSYFISAPAEPDVVITDADLVDGTRNYVEIELTTEDNTPLTKAFWDPDANSGNGAEFNQTVDTITDLKVNFVVSTGGFSGLPDRLPLAIIDTDGGGVIKVILDRRRLYGRLSLPNDLDNEYAWGTKVDPVYSLTMTGVSGTFTAGEQITIGGETATVVTGGGASITFTEPTGVNFGNGDAVTGVDSGATGTVNTVLESFSGVDKSLNGQKKINDALMTELKLLKGTRFWWQPSLTIAALNKGINSIIVPSSSSARMQWTGTELILEDDAANPLSSDPIAYIRVFGQNDDLILSRQETGQEIQIVEFNEIPTSGTFTLEHNGDTSDPINWDDGASDVQIAINAQWTAQVTVNGSFEKGFKITFNTPGPVAELTEASNTLTGPGGVVTITPATLKNGYVGGSGIPIADGEILYVTLPASGNRTWSDAGVGDTNYKVEGISSYDINDDSRYWIAYREAGSVLVARGIGELQAGESSEIGDNVPQSLLSILGLVDEVTAPSYGSTVRGIQGESFVDRMTRLTDAVGDEQENRSAYLRSDDNVVWTGTQLEFTSDIILEIINTKNGTITLHTIEVADSPITIGDGETIWVEINRSDTSETLNVFNSGLTPIPAQSQTNKDIFILFKRIDTGGESVLHLPFTKQLLREGQSSRLGASGSGSSAVKSDFLDPASTVLPSGVSVVIDGITGVDGDQVLFTNLSSGNNRVYELSGVGVSISWTAVRAFNGQFDPTDGDSVRILRGNAFQEQLAVFDGSEFKVNDVIRLFDGVSGDFWELSSIKTTTLTDNSSGTVFSVNAAGSENMIISYSIFRGTAKETGEIFITSDGTSANLSRTNTYISDTEITFDAIINAGDLELNYTASNLGTNATMKYFVKRWSNSSGGPTGIPNYSSGGGGSTPAAGNPGEIQYHGSGGNLDADARFKWDATLGAMDLNGLERSALKPSITINDAQVSPATIVSYDASTYKFAIIEYSVERDGDYRVGRMLVSNDAASNTGFGDDFVETNPVGVVFSAQVSGGNVEIQYVSTSTGFTGTFKYSIKRWS